MADEKKIATITFQGGRNTDVADQLLPDSQFRRMLNMRVFSIGDKGIATNILGTTLISNDLPVGDNLCIGRFSDEENNCFYYCIWNSNKYHTIYQYNDSSRTVVKVLQNLTDTNNVDILRWSKDKKYWLLHIDVINGTLFTFVDGGLNKARKFNIKKAMDKTSTGYGLVIPEDFITAYKQTAIYAPACRYITDTTRNSNNLYSNLAKFCQWWQYDDLEISNVSDWSLVPKPSDQSYTGVNSITFDNNCIEVTVATGNALVKKIFVAVQLNHLEEIANDVVNTDFQVCVILDKEELSIPDNSTYVYKFYNDGGYLQTSQDRINRNYSFMQRAPVCQAFVKSAMTYTGGKEGWEVVHTKIAVALRLDPLYLPDNTDNKLSNASLIANEQSVDKSGAFLSKKRYNVTTKFIIGAEVRKGVKYEIFGQNGKSDNYYYSFIANGSDTASTIASYIKGALRSIGRGVPDGGNGISAEGTDGSGNVYFNFDYLGQYGESKIVWTTHVAQVSYNSLKDNGTSQQLIPGGSITNYAVVYVDDDGRESLAYANSLAVIRTPYVTEVGDYKKPVHVISISHTPPVDAKYWKLVRTPQSHGIEILIQKVVDVTTDNTSEYLDLVVGSLLTYQKLHQNTILQYDFTAGDRLRLIKNVDTGTFYTGFFETEILSYLIETTNNVDHNAVLHANDQVTVGTATPDNIGKIISINGYERTIIGVVGGDTYRVDAPYVTSDTYPNYILIDRRGTIRIKKPTGITITDNTLVELLHPQSTEITTDYKLYRDCGQKYEVSDWGTPQRAHRGNVQNQTASQPAIIEISTGDAYIRDRELPVNNVVPGTQVLISKVIDANYSDFYISNMSDLGRVYPQDDGKGVVDFGSRTRYSGNYIVDTGVNGLNDFDNTARVDNNDAYGDIRLTKFKNNRLWAFKTLKDTWIPVNHTLTTDASGNVLNVSSGKLLNEMQYEAWEGGIGNFPESWFYNGNNQYHASPNSGCFIRIGGSGVEPISTLYNFDKEGRHILSIADKYNLSLIGEYDRKYDEAIWSYPSFVEYLYNDGFSTGQWQTSSDLLPDNVTYEVTQQPATGNVTYDNTLGSFLVSDTAVGNDYFLYRPVLGGGNYGAIKKQCITTVVPANRSKGWLAKAGTEYCVKKEVITIDYEVVEAPDFADANLTIEVNGVDVKTVNNTETGIC
jgi:hypothetical protein